MRRILQHVCAESWMRDITDFRVKSEEWRVESFFQSGELFSEWRAFFRVESEEWRVER